MRRWVGRVLLWFIEGARPEAQPPSLTAQQLEAGRRLHAELMKFGQALRDAGSRFGDALVDQASRGDSRGSAEFIARALERMKSGEHAVTIARPSGCDGSEPTDAKLEIPAFLRRQAKVQP